MKKLSSNKKGFTLAEVLITLGIIGIVAALTIPSLMANYQKTQYVAGLKKAYAEITEALRLMANDHGCADNLECVGLFKDSATPGVNTALGNEFKKYFKLSKDCGTVYDAADESTKCLSDSFSINYDGTVRGKGGAREDLNNDNAGNYNFITADGFAVSLNSDTCENNLLPAETNRNLNRICGSLVIDINGFKGPNTLGRDVFDFWITNGRGIAIYPIGGPETVSLGGGWSWLNASGEPNKCIPTAPEGSTCAGRIIDQGWQMLY